MKDLLFFLFTVGYVVVIALLAYLAGWILINKDKFE